MQEMTITQFDDGVSYKCFVDVPGGEGWFTFEKSVDGIYKLFTGLSCYILADDNRPTNLSAFVVVHSRPLV